jgi:hypothetical protein
LARAVALFTSMEPAWRAMEANCRQSSSISTLRGLLFEQDAYVRQGNDQGIDCRPQKPAGNTQAVQLFMAVVPARPGCASTYSLATDMTWPPAFLLQHYSSLPVL